MLCFVASLMCSGLTAHTARLADPLDVSVALLTTDACRATSYIYYRCFNQQPLSHTLWIFLIQIKIKIETIISFTISNFNLN
jgi:hypothetical protein